MKAQFLKSGFMYKLNPEVLEAADKLPPGIYQVFQDDSGIPIANGIEIKTDQLLDLPDTIASTVMNEIEEFWKPEVKQRFKRREKVYKRGILLHGAPGTGKTSAIVRVSQEMVKRGGIVFFNTDPSTVQKAAKSIRFLDPEVPILVTWEEFDDFCDTAETLTLLDGQVQLDNVTYLASTNYIEQIPPRIKNRSRRFASVIEVKNPNAKARELYFKNNLFPEEQHLVPELVESTKNFNFDGLSEMIIDVFCLGKSIKDASEKISKINITEDNEDTEHLLKQEREKQLRKEQNKAINDMINENYNSHLLKLKVANKSYNQELAESED